METKIEQGKRKKRLKKIFKWFGGILLVLILLLAVAPYLFKDKINKLIADAINENVNATVTFKDASLSFFRNFPSASVKIKQLNITNKAPFEGDTLFYTKALSVSMNITELFNGDNEPMQLKSISVTDGQVFIVMNEDGKGNYDIVKPVTESATSENSGSDSFSLDIKRYTVDNLQFRYVDKGSKLNMVVENMYHTGKGNFDKSILNLDTGTKALMSLEIDSIQYVKRMAVSLDALLGIDLENSKYTFKENKGFVNQLPLEFSGDMQLLDEGQLYDIAFETPTSSFKNLLGLIPAQFSGDINKVQTDGDFMVNGHIKGMLSEAKIPAFTITFSSDNGSFKYPDLTKSVKDIHINSNIVNTTGVLKDTYVAIKKLRFAIDEDNFTASGNIKNVFQNPKVNIQTKGVINLENIAKAYPIPGERSFTGILKADVTTSFDMDAIEKNQYQHIKNSGNIQLNGFKYEGEEVAKPFFIDKTAVSFNTNKVILNEFSAKTGDSDLQIKGGIHNLYGFLFKKEVLKGDFTLHSSNLNTSDFMSDQVASTEQEESESSLKIPSFIDCKFTAHANKVRYDNLSLSNVSGVLFVKDETIDLQNLTMNVFDGVLGANGQVRTKEETPTFTMKLDLQQLRIAESFTQLDLLKSIAPIAETIGGKINSTINLSGNLTNRMTPDIKTISGDLFGQLFDTKIHADKSKLLATLDQQINFFDAGNLNLDNIKARLSFDNGKVTVKPFKLSYKDIPIEVSGTHSFDKNMNYSVTFDVPAKYLGTEVAAQLKKLSSEDAKAVSIAVTAGLTGSFNDPKVSTDVEQATSNLVNELAKQQKDKLLDKGKNTLLNLFKKKKKKNN